MFNLFRKKTNVTEVWVSVSNRTVIRVLALVLLSIILLAALRKATHALVLLFTAFFLALALNAPVHWIAQHLPGRTRGRRGLATGISFLLVVVVLGLLIASIVPTLVHQTSNFISAAPHLVNNLRDQQNGLGNFIRQHHLEDQVDSLSKQLSSRLGGVGSSAVSSVTKIGSSIFSLLIVLALTFMMLAEGPYWLDLFKRLLPVEHKKHASRLARDMYHVVKGYVNGQVTLAALAALLISPALFILHIGYPLALIVVIFICGLIPMIGHTIGAIIVTIVALFHSFPAALIILAYYILYQQIENYVVQPRIQANTTNLSPLLVFASVVVGVSFGGLLGGLVAIPAMGCLRIMAIDYLEAHNLLHVPEKSVPSTTEGE